MNKNFNKYIKITLCICSIYILFLPLLQQKYNLFSTSFSINEKRKKASFPDFDINNLYDFPDLFEKYFNDNYGFRDLLIYVNNTIKYHLFNKSGTSTSLIGKNNWIFYTGEHSVESFKGINLFTEEELQTIYYAFQVKRDYLATMGIKYFVYMAPDKKSIYPEYYPDNIKKVSNISRYDQVADLFKKSNINFIDLKAALLKAKETEPIILYDQTGTHWNGFGAFVAYKSIISELKKSFPYLIEHQRDEFEITTNLKKRITDGTLHVFYPREFQIIDIKWNKPNERYKTIMDSEEEYKGINSAYLFKNEIKDDNDIKELIPKVLIIRDSFGKKLVPLLGKNINQFYSYSLWPAYEFTKEVLDRIETEKPDVVLHEFVERALEVPPYNITKIILEKGKILENNQ